MSGHKQSLLLVHGAVLLFALSGVIAKWLALPALLITLARAGFAALTLLLVALLWHRSLALTRTQLGRLAMTGILLAAHWSSFFLAIQLTSVAVGLLTFATFPIFVSFLEPWLLRQARPKHGVLQALLTFAGIVLLLPALALNDSDWLGVVAGLFSAFSFALLTLANRRLIRNCSALKLACYQNLFAALLLLPAIAWQPVVVSTDQWWLLMLLGVVFTALAHSLFNASLQSLSAHSASLAVSIEPVYGILAAYWLLGENLTLSMVLGGSLIVAVNIWAARRQPVLS